MTADAGSPVLLVEVKARELFKARWPGKSWFGHGTNRTYWRRIAREALAREATSDGSAS